MGFEAKNTPFPSRRELAGTGGIHVAYIDNSHVPYLLLAHLLTARGIAMELRPRFIGTSDDINPNVIDVFTRKKNYRDLFDLISRSDEFLALSKKVEVVVPLTFEHELEEIEHEHKLVFRTEDTQRMHNSEVTKVAKIMAEWDAVIGPIIEREKEKLPQDSSN